MFLHSNIDLGHFVLHRSRFSLCLWLEWRLLLPLPVPIPRLPLQFFIELRHRIKPIRWPRSHGSPNYLCSSLNIQIARAHVTAAQRLGVAEVIQLCLHYTMHDKGIRPLVQRHREGSRQVNHLLIYPLEHAMLPKISHVFQAVHFVLGNVI